MEPKKILHFASSMNSLSSVPFRILVSLLISDTAASIAGLAALPITESKVKTAPILTNLGLWQQTKAIEAAVYDINRDTRILNGTEVRLFMKDAECNVFVGSVGGNLQIPFLDFGQLLQLRKFRLVDKIGVFRVKFICV